MTDPLSVISSVGGIISLGITVCGGIISYCSALQGADEEVNSLARKAVRLQKTMHLLEKILQDNQFLIEREYADPLHEMVDVIQAGIDNLQEAARKCWDDPQSANLKQMSVRGTAKKALYPFRQKSLMALNTALDGLQMELSTAMHMAQMQITKASSAAILGQGSVTHVMIEQGFAKLEGAGQPVPSSHCQCTSSLTGSTHHAPSCRYRRRVEKSNMIRKQIFFMSTLFGLNVSASFEVCSGSYGLRLAPSLTIRAVVPFDSPAFELIDKIRRVDFNAKPELMVNLVDTTIHQLRQLYAEEKARPSDTNPCGLSILHELCGVYWKFLHFPDAIPNYSRLIDVCLQYNADCESDYYRLTPIDYFLGIAQTHRADARWSNPVIGRLYDFNQQYQTILRKLLQRSVATDISLRRINSTPQKKDLVNMIQQNLDITDISWAILHESTSPLEYVIASDPGCVYTTIGGSDPICLAVAWPDGLEMLLKNGEHRTTSLENALYGAVYCDNPSSAQSLLGVSVPLPLLVLRMFFSNETLEVFIQELIKRRTCLRDLAETFLPSDELTRLGVSRHQLPDDNLDRICKALERRGIVVPHVLKLEEPVRDFGGSVVGQTICVKSMKTLFQAGFRSPCRLAPPSSMDLAGAIERALWLIDMELDVKFSKPGLPTILELWSGIVQSFFSITNRKAFVIGKPPTCERVYECVSDAFKMLNVRQQDFLMNSLASCESDDCLCACCSGHGCSPIIVALKELSRIGGSYSAYQEIYGGHTCFKRQLLDYLLIGQGGCIDLVRSVLRLLTFQELGLSHTCRRGHDQNRWEPRLCDEEVAEEQEEERLLIQELEVLVTEFEQKYLELNMSLPDFIWGYWSDRMKEVLYKRKKADSNVVQEARKVGVWLDWEPIDRIELSWERRCDHAPIDEDD